MCIWYDKVIIVHVYLVYVCVCVYFHTPTVRW